MSRSALAFALCASRLALRALRFAPWASRARRSELRAQMRADTDSRQHVLGVLRAVKLERYVRGWVACPPAFFVRLSVLRSLLCWIIVCNVLSGCFVISSTAVFACVVCTWYQLLSCGCLHVCIHRMFMPVSASACIPSHLSAFFIFV